MIEDKINQYLTEKVYNTDDYERFDKEIAEMIQYKDQTFKCCHTCYYFLEDADDDNICEHPTVEKYLDEKDSPVYFRVDYLGVCKNYKKG